MFIFGILRFLTAFAKKLFSLCFCNFFHNLLIKSCFLLRWDLFFPEDDFFFDKNGLTVFQKCLLSVMFFSFRFAKQSFLDFRRSETHLFLWWQNSSRFSSLLFCKKRLLNLLLVMIALEISLLMKGLWLDRTYRFF